jgi:hypothetical protein
MSVSRSAGCAHEPWLDVVQASIEAENTTDISALDLAVSAASLAPAKKNVPLWQEV